MDHLKDRPNRAYPVWVPARAYLERRSPEVLALAALLLGAVAVLTIAVLFPMSPQAPVRLGYVMIVVGLLMTVVTVTAGEVLPRRFLLAEAAAVVVLNSILVAYAHTPGGAIFDAMAYVWLMVYVGMFFPAATLPFAALISVSYGLGLLASGLPGMLNPWVLLTVTTVTAGVVLQRVGGHLRRQATTDALTGTLNRIGLDAAATRAFERSRRRSEQLAIAALDLDDFKEVNDTSGHVAGDRLLADATAAWRGVLRSQDVLARTGGDEFVVILPGTTRDEALVVLGRLRASHPVAWSAGVAQWRAGESLEDCLHRADQRLYDAKAGESPQPAP